LLRLGVGSDTTPGMVACAVLCLAVSIALSVVSYHCFEKHFLRLKARFAYIHRGASIDFAPTRSTR
jgi:peptidoglycan/LPS O-acetylase OafA/YrhL